MRRWLAVLLAVAASVAWADTGTAPVTVRNGKVALAAGVASGDVYVWTGSAFELRTLDATDFSVGASTIQLATGVTELGSIIGDATSELNTGTALPATCGYGQIFIDQDDTTRQKFHYCDTTDTWVTLGDVLSGGVSGGQTITGDTAASGDLTLRGTSGAGDYGSVRITASTTTIDGQIWTALRIPQALTLQGAAGAVYGLALTPESGNWVIQTNGGFAPLVPSNLFQFNPTIKNATGGTITWEGLTALNNVATLTLDGGTFTVNNWKGMYDFPTVNTGVTLSNRKTIHCQAHTGAGTITNQACLYGENLSVGTKASIVESVLNNGTGKWFLNHVGTSSSAADSSIAGKIMVGPFTATVASARLHVQDQTTVTNSTTAEVFRLESLASNDDPNYRVFQHKGTITTGGTTNFDLPLATPTNSGFMVEARWVCHCTSGSQCASGNVDSTTIGGITGAYKNAAGTLSFGTSVATTAIQSVNTAVISSQTMSASSNNARLALVAPANTNSSCAVTWIVSQMGT